MPATAPDRQSYALQTIFSFFLGLMVVALIGVGVNTFYQSPVDKFQQEQISLSRQMDALNIKNANGNADAATKAQIAELQSRQNALQDRITAQMKPWQRNTSIILVLFATLVMTVSLVRSEQLRVLSNGLLLGGLFSMIYGAGWAIFSGNSFARFAVILFALVVALGLGYLKFVRGRALAPAQAQIPVVAGAGSASDASALGDLASRVTALEDRAAAAAAALGGEGRTHAS